MGKAQILGLVGTTKNNIEAQNSVNILPWFQFPKDNTVGLWLMGENYNTTRNR